IGLGSSEIAIDEVVAPAWGVFLNRNAPLLGTVLGPVMVLRGDVAQQRATHRIDVTVGPEETHDALALLKGLNGGVQQDAVKAAIVETDAILVMFEKGVHGHLQCGETPGA